MSGTRIVLVQCTWVVPVEVPIEWDDLTIRSRIETCCPGTGIVGEALESRMRRDSGVCWACALKGENRIVSIEGASYGSEVSP
jgi:hypothetical protein